MESEDLKFPKHDKSTINYIETARICRELGNRSPSLSAAAIRLRIAENLAQAFEVSLGSVISTPPNGGDKTLYPLLSKFCTIARPRGDDSERKGELVDRELQSADTNWDRIVDASKGKDLDRR